MVQIAFFHVGHDPTQPTILSRSLRAANPGAILIQVSDHATPPVDGVTRVERRNVDAGNLMLSRTAAYADLAITEPTLFLDTDMICLEPLDVAAALSDGAAAVCVREYNCDMPLDPFAMDVDLGTHAGRSLGEVYPYVGCAVISRNQEFWQACLDEYRRLPRKFHRWFGDQEAIRNVVNARRDRIRWLPESIYACLADVETDATKRPKICHFKGPARKQMMLDCARTIGFWP
jgi:hypothetical protein